MPAAPDDSIADAPEREPDPPGWALPGFLIWATVGVQLSATVASGDPILAARWELLGRLAVWAVAWAIAVACALRMSRRFALAAILVFGLALRIAAVNGPPTLSDDLYRYAWDGRVQADGGNPYRWMPTARAVAHLREPWLWPDPEGCAQLDREPGCSRINRATVRTIYPPVAQVWFAAVYRIGGVEARHKAWQVAGLVGEMALLALLPLALRAWGRDPRWTALYALSPFPVVEVVNNGHVDGLAALLAVAALLVAARKRLVAAGALLGAATLVKLYPAVLLPALVGSRRRRRGRVEVLALSAAGAAVVAVLGYLPHVLSIGMRVLGYLPGYLREEDYSGGGRYLLAGLLGLPGPLTTVLALVAVAGAVAWVLARRPAPPTAAAVLIGTLLLAVTPVQPWYAVVLLALATVAAEPVWALVAAAGYPYFFAVILDAPHAVAIGRISYGAALVAVVAVHWARTRRATATAVPT